jgi:uncharacterized protein YdeI (YjbR/CyaY-like superfamily)
VWLKIAKKGSGIASVTAAEAIDVALCYGWIDGQRKSLDATYFLQKLTPRRRRSLWSKINVDKVEALIAAGRMRAPGLAEIQAAKQDGRWERAYASQRTATVPPDLEAALAERPRARAYFESLNKPTRFQVILRVVTARTPRVRAERIEKLTAMLEAGQLRL